jgi:hypothetical protein
MFRFIPILAALDLFIAAATSVLPVAVILDFVDSDTRILSNLFDKNRTLDVWEMANLIFDIVLCICAGTTGLFYSFGKNAKSRRFGPVTLTATGALAIAVAVTLYFLNHPAPNGASGFLVAVGFANLSFAFAGWRRTFSHLAESFDEE